MTSAPHKIFILGLDNAGLDGYRDILADCQTVFAASRLQPLLSFFAGEVLPITPLLEAVKNIGVKLAEGNVAVVAGGDPLFFGIGRAILKNFAKDSVEIIPAVSSMQLAFSRFKEPWDDAQFISLHGRNRRLGNIMENRHKAFMLTDKYNTPNQIAASILKHESNFGGGNSDLIYTAMVGENLGQADEKLTSGTLAEIAAASFSDLNVMIIKRNKAPKPPLPFGATIEEIVHSRGLITKDEVRAATLHKLRLPKTGVFWDIGAGSGSISIEASTLCPDLQIFAIEKTPDEINNITANRKKFRSVHLEIIEGEAPGALTNLPAPDRVFIGGSGGKLQGIIALVEQKLNKGGIIVINAVIEKTKDEAPALLHQNGFQVEMCEISICRYPYPASQQDKIKYNPITIITGKK